MGNTICAMAKQHLQSRPWKFEFHKFFIFKRVSFPNLYLAYNGNTVLPCIVIHLSFRCSKKQMGSQLSLQNLVLHIAGSILESSLHFIKAETIVWQSIFFIVLIISQDIYPNVIQCPRY